MKVLFIGGTGIISSASSRLAVARGIDLYHLNRGRSSSIRSVEGVKTLVADVRDEAAARQVLKGHHFDAVVDWVAFTENNIEEDIRLFRDTCDQFVFISSASAYQTPPRSWPITEDTPLENSVWEYSRNKIACEMRLRRESAESGFPVTIVRPSHTYDKTLVPLEGGYTVLDRMKRGLPVMVHGDGSSLWTLTHHRDFAVGLVGLLGNPRALGRSVHITSDEYFSWDEIVRILAEKMGVEPGIVHIPSEFIARYDRNIGDSLLGDKTHSMIFDNSLIKELVPDFKPGISFRLGAGEIVAWYEEDEKRQTIDSGLNRMFDRIIEEYGGR